MVTSCAMFRSRWQRPATDDETTPIRLAKVPEFPYPCDEAGSGKDSFDHVASSLPSVPLSAWGGTSREPRRAGLATLDIEKIADVGCGASPRKFSPRFGESR